MLPDVHQLLLLVGKSSPEQEDDSSLRPLADGLDDRVRETLPSQLAVRVRLVRSTNEALTLALNRDIVLDGKRSVEHEDTLACP